MGRVVRRVPADWQHPKNERGDFIPLFGGSHSADAANWDKTAAAWERGEFPDYASEASRRLTYEEWDGPRPLAANYMPDWPKSERTHWQMYEDTSEGTPISPVMESPEKLARWLADNGASAFADMTASYEAWLATIKAGWAPSAMASPQTGLISGVEAARLKP